MSSPAIAVEELGKSFREGFLMRKKVAIESLSFALMPGSIYGFLGPNGAGKTTTLHLLMGFLRPSHGRAFLCGLPAGDPASRRDVGFLPEVFAFDRFSTGLSLLARFDALAGGEPEGRNRRVREALDAVDLGEAARRRIGTYSKGMTQRIGLAQALLRDPDVLLLDEPMSGMDPATRKTVLGLLAQRRDRGKTTLLSSHILADVESVADRVLIIDHGKMVAEGPLSSLGSEAGGSAVIFADPAPVRFDPLLRELGLAREPVAGRSDLHRVVAPSVTAKNRLIAALSGNGADIVSVTPQRATLEEVYLGLTGPAGENARREATRTRTDS